MKQNFKLYLLTCIFLITHVAQPIDKRLTEVVKAGAWCLIAFPMLGWATAITHELGHAYTAKALFNVEGEVYCPINIVDRYKKGSHVTFPKDAIPLRGIRTATVFAAGPLSAIATSALIYKLANFLPEKGKLSYLRFIMKTFSLLDSTANAFHLLIPYCIIREGNRTRYSDGARMLYALGMGNDQGEMPGIAL